MTAVIVKFPKRARRRPPPHQTDDITVDHVRTVLRQFPEIARREVEKAAGNPAMEGRLLDAVCQFLLKMDTRHV